MSVPTPHLRRPDGPRQRLLRPATPASMLLQKEMARRVSVWVGHAVLVSAGSYSCSTGGSTTRIVLGAPWLPSPRASSSWPPGAGCLEDSSTGHPWRPRVLQQRLWGAPPREPTTTRTSQPSTSEPFCLRRVPSSSQRSPQTWGPQPTGLSGPLETATDTLARIAANRQSCWPGASLKGSLSQKRERLLQIQAMEDGHPGRLSHASALWAQPERPPRRRPGAKWEGPSVPHGVSLRATLCLGAAPRGRSSVGR